MVRSTLGDPPSIETPKVDPVGPSRTISESEPVRDGRLTEEEIRFIMNKTLAPEHRGDPNVIRFISSYLGCRNSRQAAQEAGLEPRSGLALRNRPDIHDCITEITQRSLIKYGYDANEIIERVKEIAGIDPVEFENPDGSYKTRLSDLSPETRRAIKKFKVKNLYDDDPNGMKTKIGEIIEVELYDKMKSLELLGKEKKLFKDTVMTTFILGHVFCNNAAIAVILITAGRSYPLHK